MKAENPDSSKYYQLRVRISSEEKDAILRIGTARGKGETMSEVVRLALQQLVEKNELVPPSAALEAKVRTLATILRRDPDHVQWACIEGIFDLIEGRAKIPLIVMESQLHLSYRDSEANSPLN
jgi:hypothetical protein